ncbi:hypothetical protein AcidC75_25390 [Acidisoma sp. C75]
MGLAMMCFRLISTLPHHIPAIAGMSSISRVDSDRFADETTGRGMERATGKVRDLAQDAIAALGPDAKQGKQSENSRSPENDATIQATMRNAGRQQED